ncbi:MAG TPA: trypsin-like peptidase domain-containing protein [Acidimicrobiales bacterium]|nr:trypsin-like peptidase domain-containing protein [Acidimicrobiales bacterium]
MTRARLAAASTVLATAAALLLAGCTGGGTTSQAASSTTTTTTQPSGGGAALSLQQNYIQVVHNVRPSVVQITTPSGLGSGIVYDTKGDIVTNDHVVGQNKTVSVQFISGQKVNATVVGSFPGDDLAVVKVQHVDPKDLHPATFDNSASVQVGQIVLAIGNPLAFSSSVTNGIVSGVGRTVVEPQGAPSPGGVIANAVQTSAPINPGNSGGALVGLNSKVIGIPTLAAVDPQIGGAAVGIGFAIPANTVKDIASQLIKYGHVVNTHRADLGILAFPVVNPMGQPAGIGVEKLLNPSPAGQAGIRSGDVIVAINGVPTKTTADLQKELAQLKPGEQAKVSIVRKDGSKATVTVTLGTLPGNAGTPPTGP